MAEPGRRLVTLMRVEIWSDVVCPWCAIGRRNLQQALEGYEHADDVEVVWRSYELDPGAPAERTGSYVEHLAHKYGIPAAEARARLARVVSVGAEAGVDFRFDDARPGNTFDAHRLLHLAAELGVQDDLKGRLFDATFTEGRPVGDRDTLVAVAVDSGIAEADARRVLESDAYADEVRADEAEGHAIGVQGVPFFVVDRRYGAAGAQPPEVLRELLERAWREANPIEVVVGGPAGACDGDGCEI
jgi:predicted DsbA family dithiol-disulfide isomerase